MMVRARDLRPSPPEDQAGVIHAMSPIWIELGQIEGTTQKLQNTKWFGFAIFPLGIRPPPPPVFLLQIPKNPLKKALNLGTAPGYKIQ